MTIKLELTEQKAQALVDLLDVATKAGGLQVAKAAVVLVDDIVAAMQAAKAAASQPGADDSPKA